MKIYEYQAKQILAKYGVAVPRGQVVDSGPGARKAFEDMGAARCVLKVQVHAGGRGKAGGIRLVSSASEAEEVARSLFARPLVTSQTGPGGIPVRRILLEEACEISRELYVGTVVDRRNGLPVMMASTEGGVEIEEVLGRSPEKIVKAHFDPDTGLKSFQCRRLAFSLGLSNGAFKQGLKLLSGLSRMFLELDLSLVEVNPLVVTKAGALLSLDAKMSLDDNALYRHEDLRVLKDVEAEDQFETRAAQFGLSYVKLGGSIGCMVNGAGLAMATMDIVKLFGGEPANFLDVGGGATTEQVTEAFRILLSDERVKAAYVNIFGGIMRCDTIANGIVEAVKKTGLRVPLVVRLEGTNVELGKEILAKSGFNITSASDMMDGARKAVEAQARSRT